jgi:hypothetical protein
MGAPRLILIPGLWPGAGNRRCGGSRWPPPTAKPTGKGGGRSPLPLPVGFAVGGGQLDPPKSTISGPQPETLLVFTTPSGMPIPPGVVTKKKRKKKTTKDKKKKKTKSPKPKTGDKDKSWSSQSSSAQSCRRDCSGRGLRCVRLLVR